MIKGMMMQMRLVSTHKHSLFLYVKSVGGGIMA